MKVRPFRSGLVRAFPSSVTCGIALEPVTAELKSKLISRSIFGLELAIDAILSRSSVDRERVGRLRKELRNFVSSTAGASLAGDVVRPRVIVGDFSALIMSSAERCSAANDAPIARAKAAKTAPAKLRLRFLGTMVTFFRSKRVLRTHMIKYRRVGKQAVGCGRREISDGGACLRINDRRRSPATFL